MGEKCQISLINTKGEYLDCGILGIHSHMATVASEGESPMNVNDFVRKPQRS